jgi:Calcineurin-like phosphoesterase
MTNDLPLQRLAESGATALTHSVPIRLLVLSDLHLECGVFVPPDPDRYDIAVLAGDIHPGDKAVHWAQRPSTFAGKPVVFVPGNHEFYGRERGHTLKELRLRAAGSNVHMLDRGAVVPMGVRFLGATLWTDFAVDVERGTDTAQAMRRASVGMNDFAGAIRERVPRVEGAGFGQALFTPQDAAREHALSRAWLQEQLDALVDSGDPDVRATVVVTHHAPSLRSMDPVWAGHLLNPCYYSELPARFFQTACLWVHGHTHHSCDYRHHRTRVVANPRGYLNWQGAPENRAFLRDLVIDVQGGGHG